MSQPPAPKTPAQPPLWTEMTADRWNTKGTQTALFATGDDGFGTGSLFADEDGDEGALF
ncbi:hypothetical protein AB0424_28670 [Streptomyces sp. NPDC051180]|uniref:hypothetical protein n=1 Tax=unclassified Streptomyces TaxID=2593676 RepID=UPI00344B1822